MPVFDWTRTELAKVLSDGSTALAYDQRLLEDTNPQTLVEAMEKGSNGFELPGLGKRAFRRFEAIVRDVSEYQ